MKSVKLKKLFNEFTHNELALYLLLGVAFLNLLTYLQHNYLGGIIIFIFIGLLTTHYTKNMVIILASSILITNLLVSLGFLSNLGYKEGLDNKDTSSPPPSPPPPSPPPPPKSSPPSKPLPTSTDSELDSSDDDSEDDSEDEVEECSTNKHCKNNKYKKICNIDTNRCAIKYNPVKDTKESAVAVVNFDEPTIKKKTKSGFKNLDEDNLDNIPLTNKTRNQERMMKEVQDQMQEMLGKTDFKNLDPKTLLSQQKQLMQAMDGMQPLMNGVNKMINGLSKSPFGSMLGLNDYTEEQTQKQ